MTSGGNRHDPHERWDELAVGYAMSALEPDELDQFVRHLVDRCPQCRRSVSDTDDVGAVLASLLKVAELRPTHRADVLAAAFSARPAVPQSTADLDRTTSFFGDEPVDEVSAETVRPVHQPPTVPQPSSTPSLRVVASATPSRPGPRHLAAGSDPEDVVTDEFAQRRAVKTGRFAPRAGWLVAAASAVVAIALSITTITALQSSSHQKSVADRRAEVLTSITAGGSGRVVALHSLAGGSSSATVVAHTDSVTVIPDGISPNDKASTYVLWGIASTKAPVALGVFDVSNSQGAPTKVGSSPVGYGAFATFAISQEPGRTAPAAPTKIVSLGNA